jgi:hypothetical protein
MKEKEKRISRVNDIKDRTEQLAIQIRIAVEGPGNTKTDLGVNKNGGNTNIGDDIESRPLVARGEDGEYEDTRGINNRQVLQKQKNMLKD